MSKSKKVAAVAVLALLPGLAACASPAEAGSDDDAITVVASTNVWGDIAATIGGDRIEVTSIIDSPDKDPHEYEATARDQLAISQADIVIENGGGYDAFIDTLVSASDSDPVMIEAVHESGLDPEEEHSQDEEGHSDEEEGHDHIEGFNEHVWYDLPTAKALAETLAGELTEIDADGADTYSANFAEFSAEIDALIAQGGAVDATAGSDYVISEPVPEYLLQSMGLTDVTPSEFPEAVEEDTDVPPTVLNEVITLVSSPELALLAYNDQAGTGQTERVREAAEAAGVPVVSYAETLPEGMSYTEWMRDNIERTAAAVAE